jgi:hypothetical protein
VCIHRMNLHKYGVDTRTILPHLNTESWSATGNFQIAVYLISDLLCVAAQASNEIAMLKTFDLTDFCSLAMSNATCSS